MTLTLGRRWGNVERMTTHEYRIMLSARFAGWLVRLAFNTHHASAHKTVRRLIGTEDYNTIRHEAQVHARGIFALPSRADEEARRARLEREVAGQLKSTINAHGPITPQFVPSAARRVAGSIDAILSEIT